MHRMGSIAERLHQFYPGNTRTSLGFSLVHGDFHLKCCLPATFTHFFRILLNFVLYGDCVGSRSHVSIVTDDQLGEPYPFCKLPFYNYFSQRERGRGEAGEERQRQGREKGNREKKERKRVNYFSLSFCPSCPCNSVVEYLFIVQ